jgi:hypothetical protein
MQSHGGYLYIGTWNENTGGEVWQMVNHNHSVYLPAVLKNR